MAVIINEFDVVIAEPEETAPAIEGGQVAPGPRLQLTPQDIYDIIQRRTERMARVWAH